jgi:formylmethanofuran dehydrogenase subunit E
LGFILKFVLILLVFAFVVYVMKAIARLSHRLRATIRDVKEIRETVSGRGRVSADMVRCSSCGSFVSARDAVTVSSRNKSQNFCSSECARSHIAK